jgi:hypothetical protein
MQASECQFKLSGLHCLVVRILGESGYGVSLANAAGCEREVGCDWVPVRR